MTKNEVPQTLTSLQTHEAAISPLRLVLFKPDGSEDVVQTTTPLKLCHGAEHELQVRAPDGSSWIGQKLGLRWVAPSDTAPGGYGLSATPQFVDDDGDGEDGYQVLLAGERQQAQRKGTGDGTKWQLSARAGEHLKSGDVTVALSSYWQAPKYLIEASVGHFRHGITELTWDGIVPIVESGNSTTLTATVKTPFDESHALQDAMVVWYLAGKEYQRIPTDASGESKLVYKPTAEEVGDRKGLMFTATCEDALQQSSCQEVTILAFLESPWADELTVELRALDGPVTEPSALGMRLNRAGKYQLVIKPKLDTSYFIGKSVTLGWRAESQQLGIDFMPKGAQVMGVDGLSWDVTGGTESGVFALEATVPELEMPFQLPGVQMSTQLADEAELNVDVDPQVQWPIFHRGVAKAVRIVPKPGSPLAQMKLTAKLHFNEIESRFPASQAPAIPAYGSETGEVTEGGVEWALTPLITGNGGRFGLRVEMPGFTAGLALPEALALFSELDKEAQVFIDDSDIPLGDDMLVLRRNTPLMIKLKPQPNSGLGGTTLKGWITFASEELQQGQVPANPDYAAMQEMTAEGLSWTLTGASVSGSLSLAIHVESFEGKTTLTRVVLLSPNLSDEVTVMVDGDTGNDLLIFHLEKSRKIRVEPSSPLASLGEKCKLDFIAKSLTDASQVPASPPYKEERALTASGLEWEVKGTARGTFGLDIQMPGFVTTVSRDAILRSENLIDEVNVTLSTVLWPLKPILLRGVKYSLKVKPKRDSALLLGDGPVSLGFKEGGLPKVNVEVEPDYGEERCMTEEGLEWEISGKKGTSGLFGLDFHMVGFKGFSWENIVLASARFLDELEIKVNGEPYDGVHPVLFREDTELALSVEPRPGSPIRDLALQAKLEVDDVPWLTSRPDLGRLVYLNEGITWTLTTSYAPRSFALKIFIQGRTSYVHSVNAQYIP